MSLYHTIQDDMKSAMKQREALRLSVLRMVLASMKNFEIEKGIAEIKDGDVISIIRRHVKQHRDSIEQFLLGNRQDLVDKERAELSILESYLPRQMSDGETVALIKMVIEELGAKSKADAGKVIKTVVERAKGAIDGKAVQQHVAVLLP